MGRITRRQRRQSSNTATPTQLSSRQPTRLCCPCRGRVRQRSVALRELAQLMRERAAELSRMIRLKILDAGIQDPRSASVVLTGGSSRLPGIDDLFRRHLTPNVRVGGADPRLGRPRSAARSGVRDERRTAEVGAQTAKCIGGRRKGIGRSEIGGRSEHLRFKTAQMAATEVDAASKPEVGGTYDIVSGRS